MPIIFAGAFRLRHGLEFLRPLGVRMPIGSRVWRVRAMDTIDAAVARTLRLPVDRPVACGFTPVRGERLVDMPVGVDVHQEHRSWAWPPVEPRRSSMKTEGHRT